MNIDISDDDAKVLASRYLIRTESATAESRALYRVCQQIRNELSRQFEKGDIVHVPGYSGDWTSRMEVRAVDVDLGSDTVVWCRQKDGDFGTYMTTELAHGERP